jgi:hypothetical protein
MKRNYIKLIGIAFILLLILNCKKTEFPNENSKAIIGSWRYISKQGGQATTQISSDYDLEFTERSKCKYSSNGKRTGTWKYELLVRNSIYGSDFNNQIRFSGGENFMSFRISNDTMYLNDEVINGKRYIYMRK